LDGRNGDGTYDARLLVRAVRTEYQAAELADGDLEPVQQLAEDFAGASESVRPAMIRILEGIARGYGAAGMAAVAEVFLDELRWQHNRWGESPHRQKPTAGEIRAEAEAKIATLPEWDAQHELRIVVWCGSCGRYRWGRQWKEPPWPKGYVGMEGPECPKCE